MVMEQRVLASCIEHAQVALASLMVMEQRVLASWVEQAQMALASLMDSVVLESFWQRAIPSSQTNFCQWALMDDLVAISLPRALLASSQRWPASVVGATIGSWCLGCGGGGNRDLLQESIPHLNIIQGAHLGWCVHWPGEIPQFGRHRCEQDHRMQSPGGGIL